MYNEEFKQAYDDMLSEGAESHMDEGVFDFLGKKKKKKPSVGGEEGRSDSSAQQWMDHTLNNLSLASNELKQMEPEGSNVTMDDVSFRYDGDGAVDGEQADAPTATEPEAEVASDDEEISVTDGTDVNTGDVGAQPPQAKAQPVEPQGEEAPVEPSEEAPVEPQGEESVEQGGDEATVTNGVDVDSPELVNSFTPEQQELINSTNPENHDKIKAEHGAANPGEQPMGTRVNGEPVALSSKEEQDAYKKEATGALTAGVKVCTSRISTLKPLKAKGYKLSDDAKTTASLKSQLVNFYPELLGAIGAVQTLKESKSIISEDAYVSNGMVDKEAETNPQDEEDAKSPNVFSNVTAVALLETFYTAVAGVLGASRSSASKNIKMSILNKSIKDAAFEMIMAFYEAERKLIGNVSDPKTAEPLPEPTEEEAQPEEQAGGGEEAPVEPSEGQPEEQVDGGEEQPGEQVDSDQPEAQPEEQVNVDGQPEEQVDGDEQPEMRVDGGEEAPVEPSEGQPEVAEEQPDVAEEQPEEQPEVAEEQPEEQPEVAEEQPEEQPEVAEEQPEVAEEQPVEQPEVAEEQPEEQPEVAEEQPEEQIEAQPEEQPEVAEEPVVAPPTEEQPKPKPKPKKKKKKAKDTNELVVGKLDKVTQKLREVIDNGDLSDSNTVKQIFLKVRLLKGLFNRLVKVSGIQLVESTALESHMDKLNLIEAIADIPNYDNQDELGKHFIELVDDILDFFTGVSEKNNSTEGDTTIRKSEWSAMVSKIEHVKQLAKTAYHHLSKAPEKEPESTMKQDDLFEKTIQLFEKMEAGGVDSESCDFDETMDVIEDVLRAHKQEIKTTFDKLGQKKNWMGKTKNVSQEHIATIQTIFKSNAKDNTMDNLIDVIASQVKDNHGSLVLTALTAIDGLRNRKMFMSVPQLIFISLLEPIVAEFISQHRSNKSKAYYRKLHRLQGILDPISDDIDLAEIAELGPEYFTQR